MSNEDLNRLAAVVAEVAALKSKAAEIVHEASEIYSAYNATIVEPDGDIMDMQTLHEMQSIETPATDAAVREIAARMAEQKGTEFIKVTSFIDPVYGEECAHVWMADIGEEYEKCIYCGEKRRIDGCA